MTYRSLLAHNVALAAALAVPTLLHAEPATVAEPNAARRTTPTDFIRIEKKDGKKPVALQTAVVRYAPREGDGGVTVDLIGAVHIGEVSYYRALNKLFTQYDALLYEHVAPKGAEVPKKRHPRGANPLSLLQSIPQSMLGLESQLEQVDYSPENFVHADMSPKQLAAAMQARGDNALTLALSAMTEMIRQQNRMEHQAEQGDATHGAGADLNPDALLAALDDPVRLKSMLAVQLASAGSATDLLGGNLNQLLIKDRNQAATKVLIKQIAQGKKRIGIFYGAAHMADFEQRLAGLDFEKEKHDWLTAWDLTANHARPLDAAGLLLNMLDQLSR